MMRIGVALWVAGCVAAGEAEAVRQLLAATPGCAAGVLRQGRRVFAGGLSTSTPMYLASVSKQFTAAAVYRLAEQGRIRLEEPIAVRIPELGAGAGGATVQQLLHHTSGLRDYGALQEVMGSRENLDNLGVVRLLARQGALNFAPGTEYAYSNSEYVLLGLLVERVSGVGLREFVRREFGVLGTDGGAAVPRTMGDGGLYGSVDELLGWMGRLPELRRIQVRGRLRNGERLAHASGLFWGRYRGRRTISHNGMAAGFSADLVYFPGERLSVVCLCEGDSVSATALSRRIADVYLGAGGRASLAPAGRGLEGKWISRQGFVMTVRGESVSLGGAEYARPGLLVLRRRGRDGLDVGFAGDRMTRFRRMVGEELALTGADGYVGRFSNDELGVRWEFVVAEGRLVLTTAAGWRIPLEAVARDRFAVGPWLLEFGADGLRLHRERLWNLEFRRE
jgi:CubicO group peptidase (beta-lactamase class C family)